MSKYASNKFGPDNDRWLRDNCGLSSPGLAIATTKDLVQIARAYDYRIGGRTFTKAATDNIAWTAGAVAQGPSQTRFYAISINAAGTVRYTQGGDGAGLPDIPDDECLIGYVKVVTNSSTTFTPDTTLFDAAGVTATFRDYSFPPNDAGW